MKERMLKSDLNKDLFENKSCIYRLYQGDSVVYVGQSVNLANRLASHYSDKSKIFDSFDFTECDEGKMNDMEAENIVKYAPIYNTTIPKCSNYMPSGQVKSKYPEVGIMICKYLEPDYSAKAKINYKKNRGINNYKYYEAKRVNDLAEKLLSTCVEVINKWGE